MRYLPHTPEDVAAMLAAIGARSIDDLFAAIPAELRASGAIRGIDATSEVELERELDALRCKWRSYLSFAGAGLANHHVPAAVSALLLRGELFTAYTPYQPEASQGTLQAIFEYQTMAAELLGMEVANASMYDGASATAEAVLMALRINPRARRVLLASTLHPEYRETVRTYLAHTDVELVELGHSDGLLTPALLAPALDGTVAALVVQSPNFFGLIEEQRALFAAAAAAGAVPISVCTEPLALGLLESPGALGAQIAVAEGTGLGVPPHFGGPGVALFATRLAHVRKMPGRLVGETVDGQGRRGFVLTLSTREQHIRREKATSNICTNHGLVALAVAINLALLGPQGLRRLAEENARRARAALARLRAAGARPLFAGPCFNELALRLPRPLRPGELEAARLSDGRALVPGVPLARFYPGLDGLLVQVTERHNEADIEHLARWVEGLGAA